MTAKRTTLPPFMSVGGVRTYPKRGYIRHRQTGVCNRARRLHHGPPRRRPRWGSTLFEPLAGFVGHCSECPRRLVVTGTAESHQACRDHSNLLDRRGGVFLEVAQQPADRDPRMPARRLPSDQGRQLECLDEADVTDLLGRRLGDEQVVVLECSFEDCARMALRGRRASSPGPSGTQRLPPCRTTLPDTMGRSSAQRKFIRGVEQVEYKCFAVERQAPSDRWP